MVKTQEEDIELEKLKHNNKLELLVIQKEMSESEHKRKIERLDKLIKIAELGGVSASE